MNTDFLEVIAREFIGDYEDSLYERKPGAQIVKFFNSNFGYDDKYGQGFPTRWIYTKERLAELLENDLLNDFFSIIMSVEFHIKERDITVVDAVPLIGKIKEQWNRKLRPFRYQLIKFVSVL